MIQRLKTFLFGSRCEPVDKISTGTHTVYPPETLDYNTWSNYINNLLNKKNFLQ